MKWKHFPRYWQFVWGIHRSLVDSPHKDQWRGVWGFLWCAPEQTLELPLFGDATTVMWHYCNEFVMCYSLVVYFFPEATRFEAMLEEGDSVFVQDNVQRRVSTDVKMMTSQFGVVSRTTGPLWLQRSGAERQHFEALIFSLNKLLNKQPIYRWLPHDDAHLTTPWIVSTFQNLTISQNFVWPYRLS